MPFVVAILALVAVVGGVIFFFRNEANAPIVEVTPVTQVATTTTPPPSEPITTPAAPTAATGSAPVATNTNPITPPKNPPVTQAKPTTPAPTPTPTATPVPTPAPVVTAPTPKTLTSKIDYRTPSGAGTSITVTMTLEGSTVTAVDSTYTGNDTDKSYQNRFDGAYKSQVIGKKLGDVSLARVGGASLTSKAFNEATKAIISQS